MANLTTAQKLKRLEQLEQANRDRSKQYLEKHIENGKKQVSGLITEQAYNEVCRRRDVARDKGQSLTTGDIISQAIMNSITNQAAQLKADISQTLTDMDKVLSPLEGVVDTTGIIEPEQATVKDKGKDSKQLEMFVDPEPVPDTATAATPDKASTEPAPMDTAEPVFDLRPYKGVKLPVNERRLLLIQFADSVPEWDNEQCAKALHKAGVLCGNGKNPWTEKKFRQNLFNARKAQGGK